ncbi:uncharacterized protein EKO05_0009019 [Ascochyta rabiei]|uniref:uncharacterized protein n=1 Tax=Didymella rabiei TaxID=5454 RepID=UPI00190109F7|nr:uncharacterized protein EKO05_0009019 [Ascochyta rabiei]UPX18727.1 hypothetical protein EKO05_0009019 [Ascochyta rabiei]
MHQTSKMHWTTVISVALGLSAVADTAAVGHSRRVHENCPSLNGSFSLDIYQLYPENSAFDPVGCKLYMSSIYNASVVVYDIYTTKHQVLTFPGITDTEPYHMAGVDYDASSGAMFFTATSGLGFETNGVDLSGPQKVIKWNTTTMETVYIADLAPFQEQFERTFGHATAGFQDIAEDSHGNSYAPASFGGYSIAKIAPNGTVTPFFTTNETAKNATALPYLSSGLVYLPSKSKLLISDGQRGTFVTFETKSRHPVPKLTKISNWPSNYTALNCDGIIAPDRYPGQTVVLCAEDYLGGSGAITVFSSKNDWATAKYLGVVYNSNPSTKGFLTTTAVEITNSIYLNSMPFSDGTTFDTHGNRSSFPIIDITSQVDTIVRAHTLQ